MKFMNTTYISKDANEILIDYLKIKGCTIKTISSENVVDKGISNHPDIFLCRMGYKKSDPIFFAQKNDLSFHYPGDVAFNAACTGKYFIHNTKLTNPKLLEKAKSMGMNIIHVKQGYTKCSIVVVDENSIITYDKGIATACQTHPELDVCLVRPGFVRLDGYDTGFIGGCSGRIGDEVIFNGNLPKHPDFKKIVSFVQSKGLSVKYFEQYELTDIGSII